MCTTYEYECRVQVFVMLRHEFPVVLLSLLAIVFIEFGAEILLRRFPTVLFLSVRGVSDGGRRDAKLSLPICRVFARFTVSILPQYPSTVLVVIGGRRAMTLGLP